METRKYSHSKTGIGQLLDKLKKETGPEVRKVVRRCLRAGFHPYYVDQYFKIQQHMPVRGIFIAGRVYDSIHALCSEHPSFTLIPDAWAREFLAAPSRLYHENNTPRQGLAHGIIDGVAIEAAHDAFEYARKFYVTFPQWERIRDQISERVLGHPDANLLVLDSLLFRLSFIQLILFQGQGVEDILNAGGWRQESSIWKFFERKVESQGVTNVVGELLANWDTGDMGAWRGYFLHIIMAFVLDKPPEELAATGIFETLLAAFFGTNSTMRTGARRLLNPYGAENNVVVEGVFRTYSALIGKLKEEFPHPRAVQVAAQWFQFLPKKMRNFALTGFIATSTDSPDEIHVDTRVEFFIEELFGEDVWNALCDLIHPSNWGTAIPLGESGFIYTDLDQNHPAYKTLEKAIRVWNLTEHKTEAARTIENCIHSEGVETDVVASLREELLNALSGDVMQTVSHLRDAWMPYRRKRDELLHRSFPVVEVARWKQEEQDQGPACKFKVTVRDFYKVIRGGLDTEGVMELERILVLTPKTRMNLQLVVLQTLGAVLLPRFVESLPPSGGKGQGVNFSGEVWAARPVIHTLGDLTRARPKSRKESGGTRINPTIAQSVFLWLFGEVDDIRFRIFEVAGGKKGNSQNHRFVFLPNAHEELNSRFRTLSKVYMRTVRAYSRPVGVYLGDDSTVVVQKMSELAERKYRRYREDGGRELQFSPVRKTYTLPGDIRIILDVPRTFNQGTFHSLRAVFNMIIDPDLKERSRQRFVM